MKINLIISAVFPPEPIVSAKLSFDIANALSANEKVTVISPKPSRPYGFRFNFNIPDHNFNHIQLNSFLSPRSNMAGRFIESYSFGRHSYKYISKNHKEIKVIYANTWPLLAQFFVVRAANKFNIPVIIHVQDMYPESLTKKLPLLTPFINSFLMPIDKYVLKNANCIIAISMKMKKYLAETRKIAEDKITVVRNWQDEEEFMDYEKKNGLIKSEPGVFTFMYLGNMGAVAGIDLLIDSFVDAQLPHSRLILAGSGSMREALKKKTASTKGANIEFWQVPQGKVPEIQSIANILLLPLKKGAAYSSIPSKLTAYMFSKKPIIACVDRDSDSADCIKQADCGYVLEPENTKQLSKCMNEISHVPAEQLKKMGENGFAYAYQNMSKTVNLKKIISLILKS